MALSEQLDRELLRARIVLLGAIVAFGFLGAVLWRIQVFHAPRYQSSLFRQSMRRVRLPAVRGTLSDRNGKRLADNRPSYCLAIYVEELRKPGRMSNTVHAVERVVQELAEIMELPAQLDGDEITRHVRMRRPLPFLAFSDIGQDALARWAESGVRHPGVDIYVEPVRVYPNGSVAAHVLGHVGRADIEKEEGRPYHYYLPEMEGKDGVEQALNDVLVGEAGGRLIRVDASGFKYSEAGEREPQSGRDVMLTIDFDIQVLAETAIADVVGAVVVLDPSNGDVLAMASTPSFDPNRFSSGISTRELAELSANPDKPFFNRAVSGTYPPGSTFKPIVAIAALENRRAEASTVYDCPGYYEIGGVRINCWRHSGHGTIAMREALEQSCNAYFCQLGLQCGYERIYHMAEAMYLGRRTGIGLRYEASGLLPDSAWKERMIHDSWRSGDTCNISIGQGYLAFTPLQMALATATIANGGYVYRPRLVLDPGAPGELLNRMNWSPRTCEVVRGGMYDVVQAENGTGKRVKLDQVAVAAKTGTAEYGPRSQRKKYAWLIAFAPFDNPRFAVAMVVEEAVSGGTTSAPRVKRLLEGMFGITPAEPAEGQG